MGIGAGLASIFTTIGAGVTGGGAGGAGAAIGALGSIGFGVAGAIQSSKAAKAQERAQQIQESREKFESSEKIRQAVRAKRIKTQQLLSQSQAGGTASSSGEIGAISSLSSDTGANVSFATGRDRATTAINAQNRIASSAQQKANLFNAGADLSAVAGKGFKTIFG